MLSAEGMDIMPSNALASEAAALIRNCDYMDRLVLKMDAIKRSI